MTDTSDEVMIANARWSTGKISYVISIGECFMWQKVLRDLISMCPINLSKVSWSFKC